MISIEVNGVDWNIVFLPPNNSKLRTSEGIYTIGVTDNNDKCIYINNRLNDYMLDKVMSHELCHVFCFSYGILLDIETEELIADFIATYGRDVFDIVDGFMFKYAKSVK